MTNILDTVEPDGFLDSDYMRERPYYFHKTVERLLAEHRKQVLLEAAKRVEDKFDFTGDEFLVADELRRMSDICEKCGGVKQQQFGSPLSPCFCEPSEIDRLRAEVASLKEEPKWKVQAEALWSMALILETEIKDESKNALFRSGVQVSIAKLKTTAQMLMDFQEDYVWNAETVMEPSPK